MTWCLLKFICGSQKKLKKQIAFLFFVSRLHSFFVPVNESGGGIWLNFNPSERLLKETKGVSVYKPMPSANRKQLSATGQLSEDVLKRKAGCQGREPKG